MHGDVVSWQPALHHSEWPVFWESVEQRRPGCVPDHRGVSPWILAQVVFSGWKVKGRWKAFQVDGQFRHVA